MNLTGINTIIPKFSAIAPFDETVLDPITTPEIDINGSFSVLFLYHTHFLQPASGVTIESYMEESDNAIVWTKIIGSDFTILTEFNSPLSEVAKLNPDLRKRYVRLNMRGVNPLVTKYVVFINIDISIQMNEYLPQDTQNAVFGYLSFDL